MKKSGICIKCNGSEVYSNRNEGPHGERSIMAGPGGRVLHGLYIHVYICLNCGFFEEYVVANDLNNEKKINHIKSNWNHVE